MSNQISSTRKISVIELFDESRTYNEWLPRRIPQEQLKELYDHARWGPTSANICPARFVFVESSAAKARLKPFLFDNNQDRMMSASCCVLVARDTKFTEFVPKLFPGREMIATFFELNPDKAQEAYVRNTTLQGAYLMMAARSMGIDCGPMSGFDEPGVNAEFFPDGRWDIDFIINLGFGDVEQLWPRCPRLSFDDACRIL
jgi:3-hydroxypropanoate dehydrogenase